MTTIQQMKTIIASIALFLSFIQLNAQGVTLLESNGWLESASITWTPLDGTDNYNVYFTGQGITNRKIDTQLIRSYGSYFRADVLGLAAGNYTITVRPVKNGVEGEATTSSPITVLAHERNGFAHSNGRVPGAYNMDGTLKNNAVVIYITEENKNTYPLFVIGANSNPCIGLQAILDGFKRARDTRPLCIRLVGTVTNPANLLSGDAVIENGNNAQASITVEGVGSDALIRGWGIRIKNASNIEIRNLGFMLTNSSERDNVGLQQTNEYIWVHHTDQFYGTPGSASDQAKGDGALDVKRSTYVTISYNHFWDTGKSCLLGLGENTNEGFYATYHHNWFDHSDSRHPRVRNFTTHIYNNYFDGNSVYGIGSTLASSLFVEGNYFRGTRRPMMISRQGTDILNSAGTFSGENGGIIKAHNNFMVGQNSFSPYHPINRPTEFDAYVATSRDEIVPSNVTAKQGSSTYNNFDTNPNYYVSTLTIDSPEVAKDKVMMYAGRMFGGDIQWTFNNAVDDNSNALNIPLRNFITNYTSPLEFIQGESSQTLTVPYNNMQTVPSDANLNRMVYVWGGTATDVIVNGLPANGVTFQKDMTAKTLTISGNPNGNVFFIVATTGTSGLPVMGNGSITVGLPAGDEIHNFTASAFNSNFYQFLNANMNSNLGNTSFDGLPLRARLTLEAATQILYTTYYPSTLTLVFEPGFSGTVRLNGVNYNASGGVAVINNVPAGDHVITRGNSTNLFFIKTSYGTLNIDEHLMQSITLFPNPTSDFLYIGSDNRLQLEKSEIYNLKGQLIKRFGKVSQLQVQDIPTGLYIVKLFTSKGTVQKKFMKK